MSEKPIVESIENLCENLSVSDLPTLKDYLCELKAEFDRDSDNYDYFFADLLHDTYSYNKRIDSGFASHVDYQIAVLKAALETDWPLFDPSLDIGIEIARQVNWHYDINTAKLFEFMLDHGFDSSCRYSDQEEWDHECITDWIGTEISYAIVCEGESPDKVMPLVAGWETLKAHKSKLPYHGFEAFNSVHGRVLKAVYAKHPKSNGTAKFLDNKTDWTWSNELIFDFDGKLLVYDTEAWVNPHILNNDPTAWFDVSDSFQEHIGKRLQQISFQCVQQRIDAHTIGNMLVAHFDFHSARTITAFYDEGQLLIFKKWIGFKDWIKEAI